MSQWGKRDNISLVNKVTANLNSTTVLSSGAEFGSANIDAGDSIFIGANAYKVAKVNSTSSITLDVPFTGANTVTTANVQQSPKDLRTYGWGGNAFLGANTVSARNVYGIDRVEVAVPENKERGIAHTGWVHHRRFVNGQGTTRNHSEVLVAMSKNFNANAAGVLNQLDASDDLIVPDVYLEFAVQPTSQSNTESNAVVFTSTAVSVPAGSPITYQWFRSTGGAYAAVNNGGDFSGNTTNTLSIANVSNVDGDTFKLTISTTVTGVDSVDSDVVTATEL